MRNHGQKEVLPRRASLSLSRKTTIVIGIVVVFAVTTILVGLPYAFSELTMRQMKAHAETFGLFLRGDLVSLSRHERDIFASPEAIGMLSPLVAPEFANAGAIADGTKSFSVISIELFNPRLRRAVAWSPSPKWQPDGTINITPANLSNEAVVLRSDQHDGMIVPMIQELIVPVDLGIAGIWTILIHLDFQKSMELHQDQYLVFQTIAVAIIVGILIFLMVILLRFIRVTIVRPASRLSQAMTIVGSGRLDMRLEDIGNDEFGEIGRQFNAMVSGLQEKQALSKYVSRSTMQAVKQSVRTGDAFHKPQRLDAVVFFSDIRGFTAYSEKHDPETVIKTLNRILGIQASIIVRHGGDIDKFVGDETMAVFSGPIEAFRAALTIQVMMNSLRIELDSLRVGIGLCKGPVVQGDVGIESMKDFTVIGDTVNIAARLQSVARGGEILLPRSSIDDGLLAQFRVRPKGLLHLKGKELALPVVSLVGTLAEMTIATQ